LDFFSEDLAAKATILAGQLGSLLEAGRLTRVSREQRRRAQILVEVAQTLHSMTDAKAVVEAVADRLRVLLRTRLVCVMLRQDGAFSPEEKSVISAVAGFGSIAIANAELYSSSRAHTHELHQLLDVSSELGSIGQLDDFLQKFALRAADFLGFGRAFIGLLE